MTATGNTPTKGACIGVLGFGRRRSSHEEAGEAPGAKPTTPLRVPSGHPQALRHSIAAIIGATALVVLSACWAAAGIAVGGHLSRFAVAYGAFVAAVIATCGLTSVLNWAEEVQP